MWIFLELFDGIQVGGLSSYPVSLSTLSNDFSQCQIFSSALGALVLLGCTQLLSYHLCTYCIYLHAIYILLLCVLFIVGH